MPLVAASLKPLGSIASLSADGVRGFHSDGASVEHDYSLRPSDVNALQNADLSRLLASPEMKRL